MAVLITEIRKDSSILKYELKKVQDLDVPSYEEALFPVTKASFELIFPIFSSFKRVEAVKHIF